MIRSFFIFFIIQTAISYASSPLGMSSTPALESSPTSKEIRKVTKSLEDPFERDKLIKTLRILASAQELEEKKERISLVSYLMPVIQYVSEGISEIFVYFKKIPEFSRYGLNYFRNISNRQALWTAILWFPLLILIGAVLEGVIKVFLKRRLLTRYKRLEKSKLDEKRTLYAYMALLYPFLYSLLFLPLFISSTLVGNWMIIFWMLLFATRLFFHERKRALYKSHHKDKIQSISKDGPFFYFLGAIGLWVLILFGLSTGLEGNIYSEGLLYNVTLATSYPLLILYFREWKVRVMPRQLAKSRTLQTVPHKLASPVNFLIQYIPWFLLIISLPICIDKIFFEGQLWNNYASMSIETLLILMVFLIGRQQFDAFALSNLIQARVDKVQALKSYINRVQFPLISGVQWFWHIAFLGSLLAIWFRCFSNFLMGMLLHPFTTTILLVGLIWGIIYLLWIGIELFFVFHTKPQVFRGKKKEPTIFAKTFGPMLHSVAKWIMILVGSFVTLESLGFDLKVLVYLMSALAFAISLGSQSLVKDIINGFFALIDGSFAVGEVVTVGTHTGVVESLSLRAITLRHRNGSLQTIPFSEVGNIINRSRDFTVVPIDVATSYKTKIGKVYEALTVTFNNISQDPFFGSMIMEPLVISGIDRFVENAVHVSAYIKVTPDPTNKFAQEFNRLLKIQLDAFKIAPPIAFQEKWTNDLKPIN